MFITLDLEAESLQMLDIPIYFNKAFIAREVGITRSYLSMILSGKRTPAVKTLIKLNKAINKLKAA